MNSARFRFLLNPRFVALLYAVLVVIATTQHYLKGTINNYYIFVKPFFNLLAGKNLYLEYPEYYYDTYKYSPTFALAMGVFAVLPTWLGLLGWNALNGVVLYTASRRLFPEVRRSMLFLLLIVVDVMTSLHNSQANCLLLGLMLWVYIHLQNERPGWAALCVVLAFFIKIYGIGIGVLFLLYPNQIIRAALWGLCFGVLLAFSPLLVVSWPNFLMIYQGWFDIVRASATAVQLSLMGVLDAWFGLNVPKGPIQAVGLFVLLLPLAYFRRWQETDFRRLYVSSVLIFVVIFNQMAESPTFIMPVAGFMFWWLYYRRSTPLATPLLVLVLIFTTLSATDLFPGVVRDKFFDPYKLKAVPMILAWFVIQGQLLYYPRYSARLAAAAASEAA